MNGSENAGNGSEMYDPYTATAPSGLGEMIISPRSGNDYHDYTSAPYRGGRGGGFGRGGDRGSRRGRGGDRGGMRRGGRGGPSFGGGGGPDRRRPEKPAVSTKIYVTSLPDTCRRSDLMKLFEEYGTVVECDIVKHYAFIHFDRPDEAKAAVDALNHHEFQGSVLKVELSISRVRQKPGMGGPNECYKCGKGGHWSKDCLSDPGNKMRRPPPRSYPEDDYYDRPAPPDPYYRDPYYRDRYPPPPAHDRYRPYDPYERRRYPAPPPPPTYEDSYYHDPYARPPPEVYDRGHTASRDPYYGYDDKYDSGYQAHAAAPHMASPHAEGLGNLEPSM